ncbi:MAG TPA: DEAD/DEAH box helicase family protein [Ohtaekwangia sp.]|nr:DEAD/DEAH box helicase family protein [Ohtaekwangia sp.]
MSNFNFLSSAFSEIKSIAQSAEKYAISDPRAAIIYSRLCLEHGVYWLYNNESALPRLDKLKFQYGHYLSLDELINLREFDDLFNDSDLIAALHEIRLLGNKAVHRGTERFTKETAITVVELLYGFLLQLAMNYQDDIPDAIPFDIAKVPTQAPVISDKEQKRLKESVEKAEKDLQQLQDQRMQLQSEREAFDLERENFRQRRLKNAQHARYKPGSWTEDETRIRLINVLLLEAGWDPFAENTHEFEIDGLPKSVFPTGKGRADYVLWDDNHKPLAVIEAKRTFKSAENGKHQAKLYADGLEKAYGQRPIIFYSNGFNTWLWEDHFYPSRLVMGFLTKEELRLALHRKANRTHLLDIEPNKKIVGGQGRAYQISAVTRTMKRFCDKDQLIGNHRKGLLVMATGAGKTRTAAAIIEVLAKANWVKRVLFLADRNALVDQAKKAIAEYLPSYSCRDITKEDDDESTRIVFSTYQTIINRIERDDKDYSIGHFDLIIVDEAHRSIYNRYRSIFDYFDSMILGLTATPRNEVDFDTFVFFGHGRGEPIYSYDLFEAAEDKHLLLPKGKKVDLGFIRSGIRYNDLVGEEKLRYEETFADEHGNVPEEIDASAINEWLYNEDTIVKVLEVLMRGGIMVADKVGKTIIFAKNRTHAELITKTFEKQYPSYGGDFCQTIHYETEKSGDLIDRFKDRIKLPRIAVSVDMLDTGIDVPELVNLVFFKPVYSKAKYWQMVGRGTRKCEDLFGPGQDKEYFYIFDFCGNFDFFEQNPEGLPGATTQSLSQQIFTSWLNIIFILSSETFTKNEDAQRYRRQLLDRAHFEVKRLEENKNNVSVRRVWESVLNYLDRADWDNLEAADRVIVLRDLAPIVEIREPDQYAKRFDHFVHQMQISLLEENPDFENFRMKLVSTAFSLNKLFNVPEVQEKKSVIQKILKESFWQSPTINALEEVRSGIRNLIKHIDKNRRAIYHTNFTDRIDQEIEVVDPLGRYASNSGYNFEKRLESLLELKSNHLAVQKIRRGDTITNAELNALQEILLEDVREDQKQGMKEYLTKLSLVEFIKSTMGMDRNAVKGMFAEFERKHRLSDIQTRYLQAIVNSISINGIIDVSHIYDGPEFRRIHDGGIMAVFSEEEVDEVSSIVERLNRLNRNAG